MFGHIKRLLTTGIAYQLGDVVAKLLALVTLPLYTQHLTRADYGTAELLLTMMILVSIIARFGIGEAFLRFYFLDEDPLRRLRVARIATGLTALITTVLAVTIVLAAHPIAQGLLGDDRATELRIAALGLWGFTNLEVANAILRAAGRARTYLIGSLINVGLTVSLTVWLVVLRDEGASGYLLGNFGATTIVVLGLWIVLRDFIGIRRNVFDRAELGRMLRFGLPTVPAEVSVFALFVIDRLWLYRFSSPSAAGVYAVSIKLAGVVVFAVRAFQYAWPPVAYSISDDEEARRVYSRIATYYLLFTSLVVAGLTLLGRWLVRLLAAPEFFAAHRALPLVALGWALYGLFLILVAMAGRARVTVRNFPAALCGLIVNVALLAVLVGPLGTVGAGVALCAAYVVMLGVMYALTRSLFYVPFEWRRLALMAVAVGGLAVIGELFLPTEGLAGFLSRLSLLAAIPGVLWLGRFVQEDEVKVLRLFLRRGRRREATSAAHG